VSTDVPAGLLVDWGGVLTHPFHGNLREWSIAEGLDPEGVVSVVSEWLNADIAVVSLEQNPLHALERGETDQAGAERILAEELNRRGHGLADHAGMLARLFARGVTFDDTVLDVVRQAHAAGVRTALLSNSWANEYPIERWTDAFDTLVISGEVGMRKPEPRIFEHAAALLNLPLTECVFVDDELVNVLAAQALGMRAIHCRDTALVAAELITLFALDPEQA